MSYNYPPFTGDLINLPRKKGKKHSKPHVTAHN